MGFSNRPSQADIATGETACQLWLVDVLEYEIPEFRTNSRRERVSDLRLNPMPIIGIREDSDEPTSPPPRRPSEKFPKSTPSRTKKTSNDGGLTKNRCNAHSYVHPHPLSLPPSRRPAVPPLTKCLPNDNIYTDTPTSTTPDRSPSAPFSLRPLTPTYESLRDTTAYADYNSRTLVLLEALKRGFTQVVLGKRLANRDVGG
ncbi:hypothetical protein GGR58DRAFT_507095 [Xylaria digitata]|nr:hypothetical protein GGR58DRAFT_507095 [Xylaria digitata]